MFSRNKISYFFVAGIAMIFLAGILFFDYRENSAPDAKAAAGQNVRGFAWSENIGWISFNSLNCDTNGDGFNDNSPAYGGSAPDSCPPAYSEKLIVDEPQMNNTSLDGGALGLAIDNADNVYITGGGIDATPYYYATVKYDNDLNKSWIRKEPTGLPNYSWEIAVDSLQNSYITGTGTVGTIKYDASGVFQWKNFIKGNGVVADSSGNNFYSAGYINNPLPAQWDYITRKYSSNTGSEIGGSWPKTYDITLDDKGFAIDKDTAGNIYVTGNVASSGGELVIRTVKYDSGGNFLSVMQFPDPAISGKSNEVYDIAVDSDNNYYIVGGLKNNPLPPLNYDFQVVKYNSDDSLAWSKTYDDSGYNDIAKSVAVDSLGNVYVAGYSTSDGVNFNYRIIEYDTNGNMLWNEVYDSGDNEDSANGIAVDSNGNVFVTGVAGNKARTIKYGHNRAESYGVNLDALNNLSGYAWSENIGWVSFEAGDVAGCPVAPCQAKLIGTNFSGWARALANGSGWDGWINLSSGNKVITIAQAGAVGDDVGRWTSMQLDSVENPIIAYYDITNHDLKLVHCNDKFCTGEDEIVNILDSNVGKDPSVQDNFVYPSMELGEDGFPVIAYSDNINKDLLLIRCLDINCVTFDKRVVNSSANIYDISLKLDSDNHPVIVFSDDSAGGDLILLRCVSADCSGSISKKTIVGGNANIYTTSLALNLILNPLEGIPVISYRQNDSFKVAVCNDINCSSAQINIIDTTNLYDPVNDWTRQASYSSLTLDILGNPVVAYEIKKQIKLAHCNDNSCAGGNETINTVTSIGPYKGAQLKMRLNAFGFPVISYLYYKVGGGELRMAICDDTDCDGVGEKIISLDSSSVNTGGYSSLIIDSNNLPVISHFQWSKSNGNFMFDLRLARCSSVDCSEGIYGVSLISGADFTGWAWGGEVVGWISFNHENCDTDSNGVADEAGCIGATIPDYKVYLSAPLNTPPTAVNLSVNPPTTFCMYPPLFTAPSYDLSWTFSDADLGASQSQFQLQIDDDPAFSSAEYDQTIPGAASSQQVYVTDVAAPNMLLYDKTYYWRVKVWDNNSISSTDWIYPPNPPLPAPPTVAPGTSFDTATHMYPVVNFTPPVPNSYLVNQEITFNNLSQCYATPSTCAWSWDFGDGSPITMENSAQNPKHTYSIAGNYSIRLTATDSDGHVCTNPAGTKNLGSVRPKWKEVSPK